MPVSKLHILLALVIPICLGASAQEHKAISYQFEIENDREWQLGDTIQLTLLATQHDACIKGVDKTRIFCKGLNIDYQSEWNVLGENTWEKQIIAVVTGNRKNEISITAFRKTDGGTCIETKEIELRNDN